MKAVRAHAPGRVTLARAAVRVTLARRLRVLAVMAALAAVTLAHGQPADPLDERLRHLEADLRCLVCQNQTLADSDAALAVDLRREIRSLAVAGRSDDDIRSFLVARYGDFVLYTPPLKPSTWLLWLGPFGLLALGAFVWAAVLRRRGAARAAGAPGPSPAAAARAQALIEAGE